MLKNYNYNKLIVFGVLSEHSGRLSMCRIRALIRRIKKKIEFRPIDRLMNPVQGPPTSISGRATNCERFKRFFFFFNLYQ